MRRWSSQLRWVQVACAVVFAVATLGYNLLWMAAVRMPDVELGFDPAFPASGRNLDVARVKDGSPAEKAGMRRGDHIVALNGRRIDDNQFLLRTIWSQSKPGDTVQLTVERPGQTSPVILSAVFRHRQPGSFTETFAQEVRNSFPVPFVLVGLTVLFLRPEDRNVWLLALLCASFTTTPGFPEEFATASPTLWRFVMVYRAVFLGMLGALFYSFFAIFPTRSPLDLRLPWLKWIAVALGITLTLTGLRTGRMQVPSPLAALAGKTFSEKIPLFYVFGFLALGLVSLGMNFVATRDPEARRKIRVIFWGTVTGVTPGAAEAAARNFTGFHAPIWLDTAMDAVAFLFPLSFAYAVFKHRVLEIPVLLKRSARYVLVQRGFTILLSLFSIGLTMLFAASFAHYLEPVIEVAQPSGIVLGAVFGTALFWGGSQVHRQVSGRIDHAFFRSAYDARMILEDLAEKTRTATDRSQLAHLLERNLREALQPSSLVVYLGGEDRLTVASGDVPPELKSIPAKLPLLAELARRAQPVEFPHGDNGAAQRSPLAALNPDCLVPILERSGSLAGLLVLGPRLSEEPYSSEDKRLLASVASQAGTVLDNIHLAEEISARMEAERRAAREMEIAREVQGRLLPQSAPRLKTLDCAAQCIQARAVGGDYYDFLDLGPDRVGLVLADVSGKGVHAALLMANLQAHLRSQSGIAPLDPTRVLQYVNRILWKTTASEYYATLLFGIYDDSSRQLIYVNCGHNPPMLLRQDGTVERLNPTATVIGAFEQWQGSVCQTQLAPGDLLVIFSDGVTEAMRGEEEFGEDRLLAELNRCRSLPAGEIVAAILGVVQQFSGGAQSDDLTLLVAQAHA